MYGFSGVLVERKYVFILLRIYESIHSDSNCSFYGVKMFEFLLFTPVFASQQDVVAGHSASSPTLAEHKAHGGEVKPFRKPRLVYKDEEERQMAKMRHEAEMKVLDEDMERAGMVHETMMQRIREDGNKLAVANHSIAATVTTMQEEVVRLGSITKEVKQREEEQTFTSQHNDAAVGRSALRYSDIKNLPLYASAEERAQNIAERRAYLEIVRERGNRTKTEHGNVMQEVMARQEAQVTSHNQTCAALATSHETLSAKVDEIGINVSNLTKEVEKLVQQRNELRSEVTTLVQQREEEKAKLAIVTATLEEKTILLNAVLFAENPAKK